MFNPSIERQLLLNNASQYQNHANNLNPSNNNNNNNTLTNEESAFFYAQSNEYEQTSSVVSNRSLAKNSTKSLANIHNPTSPHDMHKESPTNLTTMTTLDTGTTTSSSSYYAIPSNDCKTSNGTNSSGRNSSMKGPLKINHRNPVRFDTNTINSQRKINSSRYNNSSLLSAYSTPSLALQLDYFRGDTSTIARDFENMDYIAKHVLMNNTSKSTPNLINNLLINIAPSDISVETVTSNGAKLCLDCGITLLIPQDAIADDQLELIYLAICRHESSTPKLNGK